MAKHAKNKLRLPKRMLGVKLPKQTRKSVNRLLAGTGAETNPLLAAAIGSVITMMIERLEAQLQNYVHPSDTRDRPGKGKKASAKAVTPIAH